MSYNMQPEATAVLLLFTADKGYLYLDDGYRQNGGKDTHNNSGEGSMGSDQNNKPKKVMYEVVVWCHSHAALIQCSCHSQSCMTAACLQAAPYVQSIAAAPNCSGMFRI